MSNVTSFCMWALVLALLMVGSSAVPARLSSPSPPVWGGASSWFAFVNMTDVADAPTHPKWQFYYYYNWDKKASRYDHLDGQQDEVCAGLSDHPLGEKCTVLNAIDGSVYLLFPDSDDCCLCNEKGFTILPNWLQSSGTSYTGQDTIRGIAVDSWVLQGQSDNHYYATQDSSRKPVRFMEHKKDHLKQWDFVSYEAMALKDDIFTAPEKCASKKCGNWACKYV